MERKNKQICCGSLLNRLPDQLSAKYPCFVAQNFETQNQTFYTIHDPSSHHGCLIPELLGKQIRGCFHGWMILSDHPHNVMWSLWNPSTSKIIRLPPLIDDDDFKYCCLSSPADEPNSLLLLMGIKKTNIVFCRLDRKRKKLRWTKMSYDKQLKRLTGVDGFFLNCLTCCKGKVYAYNQGPEDDIFLIEVDIVVKDREVVITLLPILRLPIPESQCSLYGYFHFLKGFHKKLFCILVCYKDKEFKMIAAVNLFKLDMDGMLWEEMQDLEDAIFTMDFVGNSSILYYPAIASELGGYIHIIEKTGRILYSYHVKNKTNSLSSLPFLARASHVSEWAMLQCRLEGDSKQEEDKNQEIILRSVKDDDTQLNESHLLNLPLAVLETIMEFFVGVEYLKFRATCKHCHLAAPLIQWGNKTSSKFSSASPWLAVFDKHRGVITFTDPIFGDNYFVKTPRELIDDFHIVHSRDGWLLIRKHSGTLLLFNPFTGCLHQLPVMGNLKSYCFSSPPTSPAGCLVVGFTHVGEWQIFFCHFVSQEQEPYWICRRLNFQSVDSVIYRFPTFRGPDVFALCKKGGLDVFKRIGEIDYIWESVVDKYPITSCLGRRFLVTCDEHHFLVIVGDNGGSVEVFRPNDIERKWEKIDGLGNHIIYISERTCLCVEAKTPEMRNKIFFPRLHSKNGNIVFYSLDTCRYHTFHGKNIQENLPDFFQTKQYLIPHAWIEPSCT